MLTSGIYFIVSVQDEIEVLEHDDESTFAGKKKRKIWKININIRKNFISYLHAIFIYLFILKKIQKTFDFLPSLIFVGIVSLDEGLIQIT